MYASFNRFEIQMTKAQARAASHQGQCDADVEALRQTPAMRRQFAKIADGALVAELRVYGAWRLAELQDREANERRIVWIAAGNIVDGNC